MKARTTIQKMQRELDKAVQTLPERESDQAYGASEALHWVLGIGPSLKSFLKAFNK